MHKCVLVIAMRVTFSIKFSLTLNTTLQNSDGPTKCLSKLRREIHQRRLRIQKANGCYKGRTFIKNSCRWNTTTRSRAKCPFMDLWGSSLGYFCHDYPKICDSSNGSGLLLTHTVGNVRRFIDFYHPRLSCYTQDIKIYWVSTSGKWRCVNLRLRFLLTYVRDCV